MAVLFANNASGLLFSSIADDDTALVLQVDEGANFPSPSGSDYFMATLEDENGTIEICKCTSRSVDTLTVTRAQEGTAAQVFAAGARVELRITKGTLEAFFQIAGGALSANLDLGGNDLSNGNLLTDVTSNGSTIWNQGNLDLATLADVAHTHAGVYAESAHTHPASEVASGEFADARISQSSVTQHKAVLSRIPSTTQTGVTYTLDADDINTKVRYTGTATSVFTFPELGAIGDILFITNASDYALTVTSDAGVTFNALDANDVASVVCSAKHGVMGFHCVAANTWEVTGAVD